MWGSEGGGSLGQNEGGTYRRSSPVQIPGTTWKQLACLENSSAATKTDGTLWVWGRNGNGELGLNSTATQYSSPVQVGADTDWYKVNGGGDHFMAVKTDGTLWTWGLNDYGQLVQGDRGPAASTARSSPAQIPGNWSLDNVSHGKNADLFGAMKLGLTPSQL
jgi:Alpha-tubulin suppressor and related RCC1 domain-containing proteins